MRNLTEREKRFLIVGVVIVLIILLLLWKKRRAGDTTIMQYDDAPPFDLGLGSFPINFGDLVIPNLDSYQGVTSCGCGDGPSLKLVMPAQPAPIINNIYRQYSIQQNTQYVQQRASPRWGFQSYTPAGNDRADASGRYADGSLSQFFGGSGF